jgi:hypothetical protein
MLRAIPSPNSTGRSPTRSIDSATARGGGEALDDLGSGVQQMAQMLRFYESVLAERDIRLPYVPDAG